MLRFRLNSIVIETEPCTLDVQSRHLMEGVEGEPSGFGCPAFADELERREAAKGLEAPSEVVGCDEVGEVLPELIVADVVEALDGGVLDGAVHALDLTIGPGMAWLGGAVLDLEIGTSCLEGVTAEGHLLCPHCLDVLGRPAVAGRVSEVSAVIGEHGVDLVGHGRHEVTKEVAHAASPSRAARERRTWT